MSPFPQPPCEDSCALRCRGRCQLATHPAYVLLGRCTKRWLVVIHERLRQGPSDSALRTGTRCPSFSRASGSILRQGAVLERHLISNNNNNNNCICTATTSPESAGYRGCTTRLRSSGITCWCRSIAALMRVSTFPYRVCIAHYIVALHTRKLGGIVRCHASLALYAL